MNRRGVHAVIVLWLALAATVWGFVVNSTLAWLILAWLITAAAAALALAMLTYAIYEIWSR